MPWGQDESDFVWINLDYIILRSQKPKETKETKETQKNKETKQKKNNVFQTSLNMPRSK